MPADLRDPRLHRHLMDSLHIEAMVLADEARSYFEETAHDEREALGPFDRVRFSCESLKVTTRLMHVIAWLLTQRAIDMGELLAGDALHPSRRLGDAPKSDLASIVAMPERARELIETSVDLHRRVARLDEAQAATPTTSSPVRALQDRLASTY